MPDDDDLSSKVDEADAALSEVRRQLLEYPAEGVVANHAIGLYELAAIHLSATPPNLDSSALAIDALGCLVEGLGDRLGEQAPTLRDALANIRLAFVQIKSTHGGSASVNPQTTAPDTSNGSADPNS